MEEQIATVALIVLVCVFMPAMSILGAYQMSKGKPYPPKKNLYPSTILNLAVLGFLGVMSADEQELALFPRWSPGWLEFLIAIAFLLVWIGSMPYRWRTGTDAGRKKMLGLLPTERKHLYGWFFVSLAAGVNEEIVYRGTLFQIAERAIGHWWIAAGLSALLFTIVHLQQGWRAVVMIFAIGLWMQVLVLAAGDLYVAMAVHFLYDFVIGLMILRLAEPDLQRIREEEAAKAESPPVAPVTVAAS